MGCVALVRCVLMLRRGMAVVVWYPGADFSLYLYTVVLTVHRDHHGRQRDGSVGTATNFGLDGPRFEPR